MLITSYDILIYLNINVKIINLKILLYISIIINKNYKL